MSSEQVSLEGSSEEEHKERKKEKAVEEKDLLPALPCGERPLAKTVAKESVARITAVLQNSEVTRQAPEKLVVAWHSMIKHIRAGGLSAAEVQAAVAGVTGDMCVRLCILDGKDDLEAWRVRLSKQYMDKAQGSSLMGRMYEARRGNTEASLTFLLRIAPLARAMTLMRLLDAGAVCAALWRVETLGLDYCKRNATYFEQIRKDIATKQIQDIDQLMAAAQEFQDREDLPKAAAPAVMRKGRKGILRRRAAEREVMATTQRQHAGPFTQSCGQATTMTTIATPTAMKLDVLSAWRCQWGKMCLWWKQPSMIRPFGSDWTRWRH
jgi:hypothetical protein